MIKCKNCGSGARFDIEKQCLVCDYCDSTFNVLDYDHADIRAEEQKMEALVLTCPQCGAELYTTDDTAATFCSFCGSSVLLESRMTEINHPDFIIPFQITREQAEAEYKKKLSRAIFAPRSIKDAEIKQMRPIYMPYWEYYMTSNNTLNVEYDASSKVKGGYKYTDINELSMDVNIKCDGLEYDASSKLPDDLSQAYAPYYFKESKLFSPGYMSGFYADLGDVPAEKYTDAATAVLKDSAAKEIRDKCKLSSYNISKSDISKKIAVDEITPGLAMYPVWFASAQDKTGKYVNYAAVNGQSGKVAADLPIDKKRILIGTLILAIPIFLLLYLLFTPTPKSTLIIIALLAIVGTAIGFHKIKSIVVEPTKKGRKKSDSKKAPADAVESAAAALAGKGNLHNAAYLKKVKRHMSYRMLISLVIAALLLIFHPVHDAFYYGGAIISGVLCGWTYWMLFELHNRAIERPLPQLAKRGGDE